MPSKRISPTKPQIAAFRRKILSFYRRHGRKLPFRDTTDPYKIAVAEIMLQQTQVDRVLPFWERWVATWPDWRSLAKASNGELLALWSGLGYNRRALFLGKLAREVASKHNGVLPGDAATLMQLPGIGPYTAKAIMIFAHNAPLVTVDTNIRRVILIEFGLPAETAAPDIERLAELLLPRKRSRDWHNALMDYSALALPRRIADLPPVSRHSRFDGSLRQIRGEIVRRLVAGERLSQQQLGRKLGRPEADIRQAIENLVKEGILSCTESGGIRLT